MTMPACEVCHDPADVVYLRVDKPRCWAHCPPYPDAVAMGWLDPDPASRYDGRYSDRELSLNLPGLAS